MLESQLIGSINQLFRTRSGCYDIKNYFRNLEYDDVVTTLLIQEVETGLIEDVHFFALLEITNRFRNLRAREIARTILFTNTISIDIFDKVSVKFTDYEKSKITCLLNGMYSGLT